MSSWRQNSWFNALIMSDENNPPPSSETLWSFSAGTSLLTWKYLLRFETFRTFVLQSVRFLSEHSCRLLCCTISLFFHSLSLSALMKSSAGRLTAPLKPFHLYHHRKCCFHRFLTIPVIALVWTDDFYTPDKFLKHLKGPHHVYIPSHTSPLSHAALRYSLWRNEEEEGEEEEGRKQALNSVRIKSVL